MLYEGAPGCGACPPNPGRYVCGCAQALVPAQRPADPGICFPDSSPPRALVPRAEMLLRDLVLRRGCCWSSLLLHCALHPLWGFVQVSVGVRTDGVGCRAGGPPPQQDLGRGCGTSLPRPWLPAALPLVAPPESLGKEMSPTLSIVHTLALGKDELGGKLPGRPQSWPAGQGLGAERAWECLPVITFCCKNVGKETLGLLQT